MNKFILSMEDVNFLNDWFIKVTDFVDCTVIPISKIEIVIDKFSISDDCDPVDLKMIVEHRVISLRHILMLMVLLLVIFILKWWVQAINYPQWVMFGIQYIILLFQQH